MRTCELHAGTWAYWAPEGGWISTPTAGTGVEGGLPYTSSGGGAGATTGGEVRVSFLNSGESEGEAFREKLFAGVGESKIFFAGEVMTEEGKVCCEHAPVIVGPWST